MTRFDTIAGKLQQSVRFTEIDQLARGSDQYDDNTVRQATVHARLDLVLVISHLSSINKQLAIVRGLLWLIVVLLAVLVDISFCSEQERISS